MLDKMVVAHRLASSVSLVGVVITIVADTQ